MDAVRPAPPCPLPVGTDPSAGLEAPRSAHEGARIAMTTIIGWVVLGGLAGWIASALTGSRGGCLTDVAIGIVGAMLGGFLFRLIGGSPVTGLNVWSLFVAVVGSVILITIVRALRKDK